MTKEGMIDKCDVVTSMMKAIAHPQRLMMLCHLGSSEKSASELLELCDISQSQLSQFLTRMQREGLLNVRKEGNFSIYSIKDEKLLKLINSLQDIFCG